MALVFVSSLDLKVDLKRIRLTVPVFADFQVYIDIAKRSVLQECRIQGKN